MNHKTLFALVVIAILILSLTACGSTSKQVDIEAIKQAAYEEGYAKGHSDGYIEREDEYASWWEDNYYNNEILERDDVDSFVRFSYASGVFSGYYARENHITIPGIDFSQSDQDLSHAIEVFESRFSPEYSGYMDHIWDVIDSTHAEVFGE